MGGGWRWGGRYDCVVVFVFFGCLLFFSTPILTDLNGNDVSNSTAGVESPTYQRLTFNIPLCLL